MTGSQEMGLGQARQAYISFPISAVVAGLGRDAPPWQDLKNKVKKEGE